VEREHITDPNILCLPRDPEAFDIQDENGDQVDVDDDVEIFLKPLNRTSPEVVGVDVTWDGRDDKVHRDTSRSQLLTLWIEHYKKVPEHAEVASHLFTDENEYVWTDQTGEKTAPPWKPAQQVIFKLKPWTRENMAERQQKRPRPPPSDGQDPLGPFSHFSPAPLSVLAGGDGEADQIGQYHSLARLFPTNQVNITVQVGEHTLQVKVDPKILMQNLVHKVARELRIDLPGW
jgi:hypothetical protein